MKQKLPQKFYNRDTVIVAKELLGKYLVRQFGQIKIIGRITETEAYCGQADLACHASRGRTPRTEIMFGPAGYCYIYLIYGMYYCLNLVTEGRGYSAAVLIRAVAPVAGVNRQTKTNGPGKLCRAFAIGKELNGAPAFRRGQLWLEDWNEPASAILAGPRIGVDYAGEYKDKPWRFFV